MRHAAVLTVIGFALGILANQASNGSDMSFRR
jgi:hypothetical protein